MKFTHLINTLETERKYLFYIFLVLLINANLAIVGQIFLPEILELSGLVIEGLPDPSVFTVLADFWGDMIFTALIVAALYGGTSFSNEVDNGQRVQFIFARPVGRGEHYSVKYAVKLLGVLLIILVSSLYTYAVSSNVFEPPEFTNFFQALLLLTLSSCAILAFTLMLNAVLNTRLTILATFILYIVLAALSSVFGSTETWMNFTNPLWLGGKWVELYFGESDQFLEYMGALVLWNLLPWGVGVQLYKKRDL